MGIPYPRFSYIYPPRPQATIEFGSESFLSLLDKPGWAAEVKVNEQRNMIYIGPDGSQQWWNRHKSGHKNFSPPVWLSDQVRNCVKVESGKWSVIDGGIVHAKDATVKNTLYFWDVLVLNGEYLLGTTRNYRHDLLLDITGAKAVEPKNHIRSISDNLWVSDSISQDHWMEWENLTKISWIEGFVFKYGPGRLKPGITKSNNGEWLVRCRKDSESGHIRHG